MLSENRARLVLFSYINKKIKKQRYCLDRSANMKLKKETP